MSEQKIKVLYVDDEVNNLVAFKANFRQLFQIFTASSAQEGTDILDKEDIHVIITDQRMPGVKGVGFLESILERYPDPVRMLLTGYSDIEAVIDAVNKTHIYSYITKPWKNEELIEAIEDGYRVYLRNKERKELISKLTRTNEQLEFMLREKLIS
ncbi:MAG: response regulator [Chitinophagales bacterium]|nr:response regulator [Chitinophagales bacterium]